MTKVCFSRLGAFCVYCENPADTRDHIIPESAGGANSALNTVAACETCNGERGDLDFDVFCAKMGVDRSALPPGETKIESAIRNGSKFTYTKSCARCGKQFLTVAPEARYCRRKCADVAKRRRQKRKRENV